jgi:hypothetical protein
MWKSGKVGIAYDASRLLMTPRFAHRSGKDIAMDLIKKLEEFRTQEQSLTWAGTFEEYFGIVTSNPKVAQL